MWICQTEKGSSKKNILHFQSMWLWTCEVCKSASNTLSDSHSLSQTRIILAAPIFRGTCEVETSQVKLVARSLEHEYHIDKMSRKPLVNTQDLSQPSYAQHRAVFESMVRSCSSTRSPQMQTNSSAMSRVRRGRP